MADLCSATLFTLSLPVDARLTAVYAAVVSNYSIDTGTALLYPNLAPNLSVDEISFCNITVTYTHSDEQGRDDDDNNNNNSNSTEQASIQDPADSVGLEVWLPIPVDGWNERIMALGGGGWAAGRFDGVYMGMAGAVAGGYVAMSTDSGVDESGPTAWAWEDDVVGGKVDDDVWKDWVGRTLGEMSEIGKQIVTQFYGAPAKFSYFNGCSQGGRQGYEIARKYPNAFDGIAASAPAINLPLIIGLMYYPQVVMNQAGIYPRGCELDELTRLAVDKCDGVDGLVDGVISWTGACSFDPFEFVGVEFLCPDTGEDMMVSEMAAVVANASWTGPTNKVEGGLLGWGPYFGSDVSGTGTEVIDGGGSAIAQTGCDEAGNCYGVPIEPASDWLRLFVAKDADFRPGNLSVNGFVEMLKQSMDEWDELMFLTNKTGSEFKDFKEAGGKLITGHGIWDPLIPIANTIKFWEELERREEGRDVMGEWYKFFPVPGLGHCLGGVAGEMDGVFPALVRWVEDGEVPGSLPVSWTDGDGTLNERILCPYPEKIMFLQDCSGGEGNPECFVCEY